MVFTLMGTIFTSAIAGTAVLRDFEYKTHELLFTTRLRKSAFVLGRFLGAYVVTVLVLACSALGLWIGSYMPWLDADKIGVAPPGTYLWPVLVYVVPTGLFVSALFFAVGVLTRSFVAVYIQGVVLFIGYSVANSLVSDIEQEQLAALLDPFGFNATNLINRYWTVAEKNSLLLPMDGALLLNRLLWIGIGALILLAAYRMFRMEAAPRGRKAAKAAKVEPELPAVRAPAVLPRVTPSVGPRVELARLVALVRLHYRSIVRERAFLALGAIAVLMTVVNAFYADLLYGTTVYPVTYAMVEVITGSALFFVIISALYAGELVWRERGFKCDQLVDATPTRSPLVFASKVVALLGVEATLCGALILAGIAVQAIKGYGNFELDVYLGYIYGVAFPGIALLTLLAFFIHVVTNQKLVANGLIIAYYMVMLVLSFWGVHDNLFRYSQFPDPVYSDMNRYGPSMGAWLWFMAYYFSFAGLLLAVARLFLVRGQVQGLRAPAPGSRTPDPALARGHRRPPGGVPRPVRLHPPQHPRPQPLPRQGRPGGAAGRLRARVQAVRAPAAAADRRRRRARRPRARARPGHLQGHPAPGQQVRCGHSDRPCLPARRADDPRAPLRPALRGRARRQADALHDPPPGRAARARRRDDAALRPRRPARGLRQRRPRHRHRRQRQLRVERRHRPEHRLQPRLRARQRRRPQAARPAGARAHALARRRGRAGQHVHRHRLRLDRLPRHRLHRPRPDRHRPRLPAEGVDRGRPALLRLRDGQQDPQLLLVPLGAL
ncbi:hypothetical protein [Nannocystis pusilla]|uniref:ABC transporter permease n=1 Tax=Nannocystis pusilla TaxID=889268 RepID=UPI003B7E160E